MGLASIPTRREHDDDHTVVFLRVFLRVVTVVARAHRPSPCAVGSRATTTTEHRGDTSTVHDPCMQAHIRGFIHGCHRVPSSSDR